MWITKVSVKNPVFTIMLMLALVVIGALSLSRMGVDQFPDVTFPVVVVQTSYPGASPESVESDVSKKLEESINSVAGLKTLSSRSYEGVSVIIAEFNLSEKLDRVANDVRDKVNAVKPSFKDGVKEPIISRFDPSNSPILSYAIQNPNMDYTELSTYIEQKLKKRLETVRGVGQVNIIGASKRELQILINLDKLRQLGIGIDQLIAAASVENIEFPAGKIDSAVSEKAIQIQGKLKNRADFEKIIIAKKENGNVYLNQVAQIIDGQEEQESLAMLDGKRSIAINILKSQNENTIQVSKDISKRILEVQKELPAGMTIYEVRNSSIAISKNVDNVKKTIIEGALLTIAIVFLFLNSWRSTVITGLTLPISIIGTFAFMYMLGFTINVITLMALSISVGLLIDDAIVVRENIVRHLNMGKSHLQAALDGTKEIGLAVIATTSSIVAVFLPVGLMGGIIGQFFHQFGITVVISVLISMFVSFSLDPMLSSIWHEPAKDSSKKPNIVQRFVLWFEDMMDKLGNLYQTCLAWSLKRRLLTIIMAVLIFLSSFIIPKFLGFEFVPAPDLGEMSVSFYTPPGSSLEHTTKKAMEAEQFIRKMPEVTSTYTTINTGASLGKNYANIYIKLVPKYQRKLSQGELTGPVRQELSKIAGITVNNAGAINSFGGKPIMISLRGQDLKELERISKLAVEKLKVINGLVDIDTSLKESKPLIGVSLKSQEAADMGLNLLQLSKIIEPLFNGKTISTWRQNGEDYNVKIKLDNSERTLQNLTNIPISNPKNPNGELLNLSQIADINNSFGANQINRKDLSREVFIDANAFGRSTGEIGQDIKKAIDTIDLPAGYEFVMSGANQDMAESGVYAVQALILAVIFIYMVLASQFASFTQPLAIMASLPMTLIGVFLALLSFKSTLNLFSVIGFIMLMGLVTKNAILLIDYANHLRINENMERGQSLLVAAKVRLRPILMTTLAMIFGMLPLALGLSEGSEQRAPLGQAVIGGVITSSILTLVLVPVVYTLLDDLVMKIKHRKK
jgi:hydrophobic/amphiphilic exporter-1 (mainly G- bacteria), HAE1 family